MMRQICKEITVPISINQAFNMWTKREGVRQFFCEDALIQLVIDGEYEIYFSLAYPEGFRGSEGCKILDFSNNEFLTFTWNVPPVFKEARKNNYRSQVRIDFINIHKNETKIVLTNTYFESIDVINDIISYFEKAWTYVLAEFSKATNLR